MEIVPAERTRVSPALSQASLAEAAVLPPRQTRLAQGLISAFRGAIAWLGNPDELPVVHHVGERA